MGRSKWAKWSVIGVFEQERAYRSSKQKMSVCKRIEMELLD